jgi:excisionase family DNA binding protein
MASLAPSHLTVKPSAKAAIIAKAYRSALRNLGRGQVKLHASGTKAEIPLPIEVAKVLGSMLTALGDGRSVSISAEGGELTSVEAAKRLGVSRPFIIAQIEAGRLPCRMVGSHRRIKIDDLEAFRIRMERSDKAMQELADQAQQLRMGY